MAKARSSGRSKKGVDFEVEENADQGAQAAGLENGLIMVTFAALLVALILSQVELGSSFGKGMFGG